MNRNVQYGLFIGLCVIAFFVYSLTFGSALFFDEITLCLGGVLPDSASFAGFFLSHSRWAVSFWNYFTLSSYGLSVESFRVQNFILHILIAGALLSLFNLIFEQMPGESWLNKRGRWVALLSSGLFLLHPVQAQTALNILHMRLEGLMVLSGLIACFLMVKAILHGGIWHGNGWLFAALGFSVLAVGTKESIVVVPALVLLIDWFFIARGVLAEIRKRIWLYALFCSVFYAAYFILNSNIRVLDLVLGNLSAYSQPGYLLTDSYQTPMSAHSYFLTQIPLVLHYVYIFFNPLDLCIDYDVSLIASWSHPILVFAAGAIALILFMVFMAWYFERSNLVSFGIIWFFIALFPRITLVPSSDIVGDYKTFLASVGMMVLLSGSILWVFEWLLTNISFFESKAGWVCITLFSLWLTGNLLAITKQHCALWVDPVAFWSYVRAHTPGRARSVHSLGVAFANADRLSEAMDCYHDAVHLDEQYAQPLVRLGECYQRNGDTVRALSYYARAENVKSEPLAELHNNKGVLFVVQGDFVAAEDEFKKALEIWPTFAKSLFNYANLLKKLGRFKESYAAINECIRCSPHTEDVQVQFLKARLAFELRDFREVIATLEPRIEQAADIALQFMLASAYYSSENYKKAVELFEKVYNKRPDNLDVAYNYAQSLMRVGRYSAAVAYFQQCNGNYKYPFAPLHAAACLHRNGNYYAARTSVAALDSQSLLSEPVRAELALLKRDMRVT